MANPISRDPAEEGETGSVAGQPDQDLNRATDQNQAGNRGQMGGTDQDQMATVGEGGVGLGRDTTPSGRAADTNAAPGYTGSYVNPTDTAGVVPGASPGYGNVNPDYTGTTDTAPADTGSAPGTMGKMTVPDENRRTMGNTGQTGAEDTMGNTGQTGAEDTMSGTGLSGAPSPADTSNTGLTGDVAPNEREEALSGTTDATDLSGQGLSGDQGIAPGTRQGGV